MRKVSTAVAIIVLSEYINTVCEDIPFEFIENVTGISIFPRTKHQLSETILDLKEQESKETTKTIEDQLYEKYRNDSEEHIRIIISQMFRIINGRTSEFQKQFIIEFFKEHRTLQSEMFGLFYVLCQEILKKAEDRDRWFDPRNESMIYWAEKMLK